MAGPRVTAGIGSYDRHAPLLERAVTHPAFDFQVVEAGQVAGAVGRHERFLHEWAWDAAELSFSSYLVAVDQGLTVAAFLSSRGGSSASRSCTRTSTPALRAPRTSPVSGWR